MTEKVKTGLCVLALLLSLFAAWRQEAAFQEELGIQPAPFAAYVQVN